MQKKRVCGRANQNRINRQKASWGMEDDVRPRGDRGLIYPRNKVFITVVPKRQQQSQGLLAMDLVISKQVTRTTPELPPSQRLPYYVNGRTLIRHSLNVRYPLYTAGFQWY
ncbi:hypothetical protein TNCV_1919191 [Trichonephila clavipes]|nr:hypothetical protein TNCV_1919191 [Trichonephila clavipes]